MTDQACSVTHGSCAESACANPALHVEPGKLETAFPNGNTVKVIPSNSRAEAGARLSLALVDELRSYACEDAERL